MEKYIFLIILTFNQFVFSQVYNLNFEDWTANSLFDEPSGWWGTLNTVKNFNGPVTVTKSIDSQSGLYSAKLETKQWGSFLIPGLVNTGDFDVNILNVKQGRTFNQKLESMTGFLKYISINNDSAIFYIMLSKYDNINQKRDTIATGQYVHYVSNNQYIPFEINMNYKDSVSIPDTINIVMTSSGAGGDQKGQVGSTLWIDNLQFNYLTSNDKSINQNSFLIYPNPFSEKLYLINTSNLKFEKLNYIMYDVNGKEVFNEIYDSFNGITTKDLNKGVYFCKIYNNINLISIQKIIKD